MNNENRYCETCKYHDDFTWACFNGESIHRADFTNDDFVCDAWEEQDGFKADK